MKSPVFARPNLKLFVLGAVLIAVIQDFFAHGHSESSWLARSVPRRDYIVSEDDLQRLLEECWKHPRAENYLRVSHCFERRGNMREALDYLRKADLLAGIEQE